MIESQLNELLEFIQKKRIVLYNEAREYRLENLQQNKLKLTHNNDCNCHNCLLKQFQIEDEFQKVQFPKISEYKQDTYIKEINSLKVENNAQNIFKADMNQFQIHDNLQINEIKDPIVQKPIQDIEFMKRLKQIQIQEKQKINKELQINLNTDDDQQDISSHYLQEKIKSLQKFKSEIQNINTQSPQINQNQVQKVSFQDQLNPQIQQEKNKQS